MKVESSFFSPPLFFFFPPSRVNLTPLLLLLFSLRDYRQSQQCKVPFLKRRGIRQLISQEPDDGVTFFLALASEAG